MVVGVALCFNLVPTSFNKSSHVILEKKNVFFPFFLDFFFHHPHVCWMWRQKHIVFQKIVRLLPSYYCHNILLFGVVFCSLCVYVWFFSFSMFTFFLACCIVRVISPESLHLKKKAHVFSPILRHCHCEKCFRDIRYYWYNWILHVSFYTAAIHDNIYIVIMPGVYLL